MTAPKTPIIAVGQGRSVAAYRNLRGARLAASHLADKGYDTSAVSIRPRRLRPNASRTSVATASHAVAFGVGAGGFAGVATGLVLGRGVTGALFSLGVIAGLLGALIGIATTTYRNLRRREHDAVELSAERFEVLYDGATDAEHELARWWDPDAVPGSVTDA